MLPFKTFDTQQQVFFPLFAHHTIYFQSLLLCSSKNGLTAPFLNAWRGSLTAGRCKMGDVATRSTWTNLFKDVKRSISSHKEFIFFFHSPGSSETPRMPAFIPKSVACLLLCTLNFRLVPLFAKRAEQNLARNCCYYSIL